MRIQEQHKHQDSHLLSENKYSEIYFRKLVNLPKNKTCRCGMDTRGDSFPRWHSIVLRSKLSMQCTFAEGINMLRVEFWVISIDLLGRMFVISLSFIMTAF